jgi:hypothetical protein
VDPALRSLWEPSAEAGLPGPVEWLARTALIVVVALAPLVVFLPRRLRRRRCWCALQQRDVEVEVEECGPRGLRQAVAVRACSAFDPPTAVACARRCLDLAFRRHWGPALRLTPAPKP